MSAAHAHHDAADLHAANEASSPLLSAAPEGLSARRVERWLDLPEGAWQRRRLYALRLRGDAFAWLGFRRGDLVIVEPGSTEQPGRIVITRGADGMGLRRIAAATPAERRMPTVLELPLRERGGQPERIVGTVIGLLRETGTGALRPQPLLGLRPRRRRPAPAAGSSRVVSSILPPADDTLARLLAVQSEWRERVRSAQEQASPVDEERLERWDRLDASLATLCDCLARTHSASLRSALAAEAEAVVSTIRQELRG